MLSSKTAKINIIIEQLRDKYKQLRRERARCWTELPEGFQDEHHIKTRGLLVDQLVHDILDPRLRKRDLFWLDDGEGPCFPPRNIKSVCRLLELCGRTANPGRAREVRLLVYHLVMECEQQDVDDQLNLRANADQPSTADMFADLAGISTADRRAIRAFVLIDGQKWSEGTAELRLASTTAFKHQTSSVLQVLHDNGEYQAALDLIQAKQPCLGRRADLLLYTYIVLQAKSVLEAFDFVRQSPEKGWEDKLLTCFFQKCYDTKQMHMVLKLPLDTAEGCCLVSFLETRCQSGDTATMEIYVLYLLGRARYVEAFRVCDDFANKHAALCNDRKKFDCLQHLLHGYKKLLPEVQQDLATRPSGGARTSRPRVRGLSSRPGPTRAPPSMFVATGIVNAFTAPAPAPAAGSMDESLDTQEEAELAAPEHNAFLGPPVTPSRQRSAVQVDYIEEADAQPVVPRTAEHLRTFTPQDFTPDRPDSVVWGAQPTTAHKEPTRSILKSRKKTAAAPSPSAATPRRVMTFAEPDGDGDDDDDEDEITFAPQVEPDDDDDEDEVTFAPQAIAAVKSSTPQSEGRSPNLGLSFADTKSPNLGVSFSSAGAGAGNATPPPGNAMDTGGPPGGAAPATEAAAGPAAATAGAGGGLRGSDRALKTPPVPAGLRQAKRSTYRPSPLGASSTPAAAAASPALVTSTSRLGPQAAVPSLASPAPSWSAAPSPQVASNAPSPYSLHRLSGQQMRPNTATPLSAAVTAASPYVAASPYAPSPAVSIAADSPKAGSPFVAAVLPSPKQLPPTLLQMTPNRNSPAGSPFVEGVCAWVRSNFFSLLFFFLDLLPALLLLVFRRCFPLPAACAARMRVWRAARCAMLVCAPPS